jgi:hypothetical protein
MGAGYSSLGGLCKHVIPRDLPGNLDDCTLPNGVKKYNSDKIKVEILYKHMGL